MLFLFFISIHPLQAFPTQNMSDDTVMITLTDGKEIAAEPLLTGSVNLYRQSYRRNLRELSDLEIMHPGRYGAGYRYFIGGKEVEQITQMNYRQLVEKYLKDSPELYRRLGRFGFRYENVPSMVLYYNHLHSDVTGDVEIQRDSIFLLD